MGAKPVIKLGRTLFWRIIPFIVQKFKKDVSSSAKKMGWDAEKIDGIAKIVMSYPHKDNSSEGKLIKQLREFMRQEL